MFRSLDASDFESTYAVRQLYGMDSQVGLGVLGKGRSASHWLNEECRQGLPTILGRRHYPGFGFAPTRLNPADHPTRSRPIPPPQDTPGYLVAAAQGDPAELDAWTSVPPQTRASASWARFLLRMQWPQPRCAWPEAQV